VFGQETGLVDYLFYQPIAGGISIVPASPCAQYERRLSWIEHCPSCRVKSQPTLTQCRAGPNLLGAHPRLPSSDPDAATARLWLDPKTVDALSRLGWPGGDLSDVILRLAHLERRAPEPRS
jgi:hypothetical protein